jgi:hypothetical protein
VTVYDPGVVELQDNVVVPEPVTEEGLNGLHVKPLGSGVSENVTLFEKPNAGVTVIVELAGEPRFVDDGVLAEMEKSTKVKAAPAECVRVPPLPVSLPVIVTK